MSDECRDRAVETLFGLERSEFNGLFGENGLDPGKEVSMKRNELIDLIKRADYVDFAEPNLRIYVGHYNWYKFDIGPVLQHRDPWTPPKFW